MEPGTGNKDPGVIVKTDPTFLSAPEAMKVDFIFICETEGKEEYLLVKPFLHEREFWVDRLVMPSLYNNYVRGQSGENYGEHWLQDPFRVVRSHGVAIQLENLIVDYPISLQVMFQGYGVMSKREYSLSFDCDVPAGGAGGSYRDFGGRESIVSGREDVMITALAWAAKPDPEAAFDSRRVGILVKPGHGTRWTGAGGGGVGGGQHIPLIALSNVRGPKVGCFYRPHRGLILEQSDSVNFEIASHLTLRHLQALVGVVGTGITEIEVKAAREAASRVD